MQLSGTYETWLFQEPPDLDFCEQVRAVQWADIILTKVGAHVEYVGLAAQRGSVLIVVYPYPLLLQRVDVFRSLWNTGIHLVELVQTEDERKIEKNK